MNFWFLAHAHQFLVDFFQNVNLCIDHTRDKYMFNCKITELINHIFYI